jgi:4-hydroxy-3-polyprenylbenzoate decarboxylase
MYRDQRGYIEALEKHGELIRTNKEVDWDLEAGAITRLGYQLNAPAILMENIKDYPGFRYMGGVFSNWRRAAIAIGLDPDSSRLQIQEVYRERLNHPIKPIIVDDAPCQENVITEEDVNLFDLPAPMVHDGDGGRYVTTWAFVATPSYSTDWINWGMYRQMLHNERTMGGLCLPSQDMGIQYYGGWEPAGKPMPFAAVIGGEVLTTAVSAVPYGVGRSEVEYAGGLLLEPVELVKCATIDLLVPANAEVVIEGYVNPRERCYEGPFGEYTGYRTSPRLPRVAYHVTAITYRNKPIITLANMGVPTDECDMVANTLWRADLLSVLENNGVPVIDVSMPTEMVMHTAFVSIKKPYSSIPNKVAKLIFGEKNSGLFLHQVFVVDEDVDVQDLSQVMHVFATKWHPKRGTHFFDNTVGVPLHPFLDLKERTWSKASKVCFDCTWPSEWSATAEIPVRSSFWDIYPERVVEKVCQNWQEYGHKENMLPALEEYNRIGRWPASEAFNKPVSKKGR